MGESTAATVRASGGEAPGAAARGAYARGSHRHTPACRQRCRCRCRCQVRQAPLVAAEPAACYVSDCRRCWDCGP
eukprot:9125910-Alexandrium_andersonii.AAC.1